MDDFPGELMLHETRNGRGWLLIIDSPDVWGEICSSSREFVLAVADCYAAMRRDQAAATPAPGVPPAPVQDAAEAGRVPSAPVAGPAGSQGRQP